MSHSEGYRRVTVNGQRVYEHRAVARHFYPDEEQECRYCGRIISWMLSPPNPAALIVDHFDHDRQNNAPTNLVPCCMSCNLKRKETRAQRAASLPH